MIATELVIIKQQQNNVQIFSTVTGIFLSPFSDLTLLAAQKQQHPAHKTQGSAVAKGQCDTPCRLKIFSRYFYTIYPSVTNDCVTFIPVHNTEDQLLQKCIQIISESFAMAE